MALCIIYVFALKWILEDDWLRDLFFYEFIPNLLFRFILCLYSFGVLGKTTFYIDLHNDLGRLLRLQ